MNSATTNHQTLARRIRRLASRASALALLIVIFLSACDHDAISTVSPIPTATQPTATASTVLSPGASPAASVTATTPASITATTTASVEPAASPSLSAPTGEPPVYGFRIVTAYPHDPAAFTQGLDFVDGVLYEGTGQYGASWLRRVELETGAVLQQAGLAAQHFGEGIVVLDERVYQLTWQSQLAFVYDCETFEQLETHSYPTQGWGLTTDGERLIMSDGTNLLYFRDPETFAETRRVEVLDGDEPVMALNELEWVDGEVWANVWQTDQIVRIDPATGAVLGWIDLTGLLQPEDQTGLPVDVLNGIALDETTGKLYVTGKYWPVLYEIELVAP